MPTVDVITGALLPSGAKIEADTEFEWVCNDASIRSGTNITVNAKLMPLGGPWFESSSGTGSVSFTTPNASAAVTAEAAGDWTWLASGVPVANGAHVIVEDGFPKEAKKAS
jgi:hypothetical protein